MTVDLLACDQRHHLTGFRSELFGTTGQIWVNKLRCRVDQRAVVSKERCAGTLARCRTS